jgi:cysteine desulfurase
MVYCDHAATTIVPPSIAAEHARWLSCANPSNTNHSLGRKAKNAIEESRKIFANSLKVSPTSITFTSGATESNNCILRGISLHSKEHGKNHIVTSSIEHKCILKACEELENDGFSVTYIQPLQSGIVEVNSVLRAVRPTTALVSIMAANNETGVVNNVVEIASKLRSLRKHMKSTYPIFHTDAAQTFGKYRYFPEKSGIGAISFSGHKFGGPKGSGGFYLSSNVECRPLLLGGGQEAGARAGTENVAGIVSMGKAYKTVHMNRIIKNRTLTLLGNVFIRELIDTGHPFALIGDSVQRIPGTLLISFLDEGMCSLKIIKGLDKLGVQASIGSACNSKEGGGSYVTKEMKLPDDVAKHCVRFSFWDSNNLEDIKTVVTAIDKTLKIIANK